MTPLITRMVKLTPDPELAQWFDMGDTTKRPDGHVPDADMFRLPYPICCIVGTQSNGTAPFIDIDAVHVYTTFADPSSSS